ncbi:family 43 glycosylhydrolase [Microbacterium abyssi]|uniref:family 43 glycosylhydrolase n=1 Tax=Microbacterium abyssi TaxID=2782166 RepID=UPI001E497E48|nr:family 43 glycosylhydrolase [Microbacterium sp. A18JL241]
MHYIDGKWYLAATMGDQSRLTGTFMLVSDGGPEGPYRNIEASIDHPLGEPVRATDPQYYHIDGGLFQDGDANYLVLHNDLYSKMTPDMENLENPKNLPRFDQQAYSPEPYLEGATVTKVGDKYYLMHAAWALKSGTPDDPRWSYLPDSGGVKDQYDAIVAVADSFEGPYSPRYTAAIGAGHNNMFEDEDGTVWATFFRNPNAGHWADPSRIDDAALPGVVRLEHSGPNGDLLTVAQGSIDSRAPGHATLSNTSGHSHGLHDGVYEIAMDLWWGTPGRSVRIYENGELVHEQALDATAGAPQHVVVPVEDKDNGTYEYTAELVNPYGATSTTSTTVTVRDAAPSAPVVSHDNWDRDDEFTASANLWWGTNATTYRFELDGAEVGSGSLTAATPAAQHAAIDLVGIASGTHTLVVVFINAHGETASKPVTVTVR